MLGEQLLQNVDAVEVLSLRGLFLKLLHILPVLQSQLDLQEDTETAGLQEDREQLVYRRTEPAGLQEDRDSWSTGGQRQLIYRRQSQLDLQETEPTDLQETEPARFT